MTERKLLYIEPSSPFWEKTHQLWDPKTLKKDSPLFDFLIVETLDDIISQVRAEHTITQLNVILTKNDEPSRTNFLYGIKRNITNPPKVVFESDFSNLNESYLPRD